MFPAPTHLQGAGWRGLHYDARVQGRSGEDDWGTQGGKIAWDGEGEGSTLCRLTCQVESARTRCFKREEGPTLVLKILEVQGGLYVA